MKSRDGCVVPVHDEPLPCSAEFDRQTAPQITPRLQTPATVAKAKNKQRSRNGVPAVLDLINQLLLCAPTCPSLVVDFAAQRPTTTNHRQASIRRGAGAASAEAVQRPAGLHQSLVVDLLLAASAHACMQSAPPRARPAAPAPDACGYGFDSRATRGRPA